MLPVPEKHKLFLLGFAALSFPPCTPVLLRTSDSPFFGLLAVHTILLSGLHSKRGYMEREQPIQSSHVPYM